MNKIQKIGLMWVGAGLLNPWVPSYVMMAGHSQEVADRAWPFFTLIQVFVLSSLSFAIADGAIKEDKTTFTQKDFERLTKELGYEYNGEDDGLTDEQRERFAEMRND